MSDYRERACTNCGSLLHHEDDVEKCNVVRLKYKPKSLADVLLNPPKLYEKENLPNEYLRGIEDARNVVHKELRKFVDAGKVKEADGALAARQAINKLLGIE